MNALTTWDPFREILDFPPMTMKPDADFEMNRFDSNVWNPAVDISEDENAFQISADLPEVKKADIDVSVDNGYLTISGERHHKSEEENPEKTYHRIERRHGSFLRRFALPDHIDVDQIAARFENGVLEVTLPKKESTILPEGRAIKVA